MLMLPVYCSTLTREPEQQREISKVLLLLSCVENIWIYIWKWSDCGQPSVAGESAAKSDTTARVDLRDTFFGLFAPRVDESRRCVTFEFEKQKIDKKKVSSLWQTPARKTTLFSHQLDYERFKSRPFCRCCCCCLRWQNEEERRRGVLGLFFVSSWFFFVFFFFVFFFSSSAAFL